MKYLFDTFCWLERLQNGSKAGEVTKLMAQSDAEILISSISLPEISAKLHSVGRGADAYHVLSAIVSSAKVVDVNAAIASKAGEYFAKYHSKNNTGLVDCIIAASAVINEATVVTGDPHFKVFTNAIVL